MSSAVEAISCSKVNVSTGPEPDEAASAKAKNAAAASPAEHGGAKCGEVTPHCHEDEEDEEEAPKVIDLGPRVSIKDQLEKDKVCSSVPRRHCLDHYLLLKYVPIFMPMILLFLTSFGYDWTSTFHCVS